LVSNGFNCPGVRLDADLHREPRQSTAFSCFYFAMAYQISASKLQTYKRCPYAYYLRYERQLTSSSFFGSAALGTALHQALAKFHRDWHYRVPIPDIDWAYQCWHESSFGLTAPQIEEGRDILETYYRKFIKPAITLRQPLAVEGKIQAYLQVENLEFVMTGRYDRIDFVDDGLELIDYKSAREIKLPDQEMIDLQIGLYYLALTQIYQQSLKYLSLLLLRTGEKVRFEATPYHQQQVQAMVAELAVRLRADQTWAPTPGRQCTRCAYARYCAAVQPTPAPLPTLPKMPELQLALSF
jgi:putative RecB family exonuclease